MRKLKNDSNADIDPQWSNLNYSIPCNAEGLTDLKYYRKMLKESYLYGRGSQREADAVTCCSWVVTLPKEVSDYSMINRERPLRLNPEKETAFFQGVYDFIQNRYATCFHAAIHYDEAAQPHGHFFLVPRTAIDHDLIRNKTQKTHLAERLPSGRWQYKVKLCVDANGKAIPLQNYAKASDSYEWKISAADVFCKAELQNWHKDLSNYLRSRQIPGAEYVCNGKTGGKNISVKSMKELKAITGLSIEELKELQLNRDQMQKTIATKDANLIQLLRVVHQKEKDLTDLRRQSELKDQQIVEYQQSNNERNAECLLLQRRLEKSQMETAQIRSVADQAIYEKDRQIQSLVESSLSHEEQLIHMKKQNEQLRARCEQYRKELEEVREHAEHRNLSEIGTTEDASSSWGKSKGWGNGLSWGSQEKDYEIEN